MMKRKRNVGTIVLFSVVMVFVLLIFGIVISSVLHFTWGKDTNNEDTERNLYRSYKINPTTNEVSVNIIELISNPKDSIFHEDVDGNYNLITDFDSKEYRCTGYCSCQDHANFRKSSISTVTRSGLFFLVGAVSSILAHKKAKEYFQNECEMILEDECPSHSSTISSTVDECVPFYEFFGWFKRNKKKSNDDTIIESPSKDQEDSSTQDPVDQETTQEIKKFEFDRNVGYKCRGICLPVSPKDGSIGAQRWFREDGNKDLTVSGESINHFNQKWLKQRLKKIFHKEGKKMKCRQINVSKLITDTEIKLVYGKKVLKKAFDSYSDDFKNSEDFWENLYTMHFAQHLNEYCMSKGKSFIDVNDEKKNLKVVLCEGWKGSFSGENPYFTPEKNPTIKCKKVKL